MPAAPPRRDFKPPSAPPDTAPARGTRWPKLGVYVLKQGGGLDFVRKREYGRSRWLEYPG